MKLKAFFATFRMLSLGTIWKIVDARFRNDIKIKLEWISAIKNNAEIIFISKNQSHYFNS